MTTNSCRSSLAARQIGGPYGAFVELLALTGQRREEVARCTWDEIDMDANVEAVFSSDEQCESA